VIAKIPRPTDAFLGNLVIAVAVAIAVGVPTDEIGRLLRTLPMPEHRQHISTTPDEIVVIDDTYNANPEGARRALDVLRAHGANEGRRIVVTPGMVELGPQQEAANREFAAAAAQVATDLVIVRRTNRKALKAGAAQGQARVQQFRNLPDAVAWLRDKLKPGDVVLYENDLPDHYP
jgi:UDP-N-acetylmuramoyl-tripeptide--D-alanyl-D-alanine ligase